MIAFFFYIDWLHIALMAPAMLFALWAQMRVRSAVGKWSQVAARRGMTGAQAAAAVLQGGGIHDVRIEEVQGFLSDHYDPRDKTLRLSPDNFRGNSVAAFGIAAHEAGHAIQHAVGYVPLTFRSTMVPVASFGSRVSWIILMIGFLMAGLAPKTVGVASIIMLAGIALFSLVVIFQLITVPVEIDASRRANESLSKLGLLSGEEGQGAREVLRAAAWTYVAGAATAILELIYWIIRFNQVTGGGSRNDS
jgi:hypothetical protein